MSETENTQPRRRPLRRLIAWAAFIAVLVALLLPVFSLLQPRYYERYPDLRTRITGWRHSTHARVSCSGCHVRPGIKGAVTFAAEAIPAFYSQLLSGPRPKNLFQIPDRSACQKCHTSYRQVSANGDLRIPHRAHVEVLKINCPTCHKSLVHFKNAEGFNNPEMQTCLSLCHDGKKATNKCQKCHTQKEVPAGHKKTNWLVIHSTKTETINCGKCHGWSPNYCRECHSHRPPSHVGNWKKNHPSRVKVRGTKGCYFCHGGKKFCEKCHD